ATHDYASTFSQPVTVDQCFFIPATRASTLYRSRRQRRPQAPPESLPSLSRLSLKSATANRDPWRHQGRGSPPELSPVTTPDSPSLFVATIASDATPSHPKAGPETSTATNANVGGAVALHGSPYESPPSSFMNRLLDELGPRAGQGFHLETATTRGSASASVGP
ncbi:hypothetical protein VIGAN_10144000, partial [Vigna angularis var. angularis]